MWYSFIFLILFIYFFAFFIFFLIFSIYFYLLGANYNIVVVFAIHWHESAMDFRTKAEKHKWIMYSEAEKKVTAFLLSVFSNSLDILIYDYKHIIHASSDTPPFYQLLQSGISLSEDLLQLILLSFA